MPENKKGKVHIFIPVEISSTWSLSETLIGIDES